MMHENCTRGWVLPTLMSIELLSCLHTTRWVEPTLHSRTPKQFLLLLESGIHDHLTRPVFEIEHPIARQRGGVDVQGDELLPIGIKVRDDVGVGVVGAAHHAFGIFVGDVGLEVAIFIGAVLRFGDLAQQDSHATCRTMMIVNGAGLPGTPAENQGRVAFAAPPERALIMLIAVRNMFGNIIEIQIQVRHQRHQILHGDRAFIGVEFRKEFIDRE